LANADIEAARVFHEITKHSYTSVRALPHLLDWENRPFLYKIYPTAGAVSLPRDLALSGVSTLAALSQEEPVPQSDRLELPALTRLLFCAGGLTRRKRVGSEDYHFRAAPSAGALYPIEIYVAASAVDGLEAGLYHFSPADLKLRGLRRGDWRSLIASAAATRPALLEARAVLVMSAIFWRSIWKYRARAYRYCFWDCGSMLANLLAAAKVEGLQAELTTAFEDAPLEALIGADGEREGIVCLVAIGRTAPPEGASPQMHPLELETLPISANEIVDNDLLKIHRASRLAAPEEVRSVAAARLEPRLASAPSEPITPGGIGPEESAALGETILRRGSTREFAREAIAAEDLATIMAASSRHPQADFPRLTETYLVVNDVEGIAPGAYYYRRESGAFELIRPGEFRREAGYMCLEQPLGSDCSALICYMADLESVLQALGNRGYRDAHLEAGLLGGQAYLAAYALDRGATGLTFYDDDTTRFFEPHAKGLSPILMVAVGVPHSRSTSVDQD
jgi:SagB-type dehydrogenase family enzyme